MADSINIPTLSTEIGEVNGISPVFGIAGDYMFDRNEDNHMNIAHTDALSLSSGTYTLNFNASNVLGMRTLFSKDARDFQDGGHLTAFIRDGKFIVRFQSDEESEHLSFDGGLIRPDTDHHVAISFGEDGLKAYLDGALIGAEPEFTQGMELNTESLIIGANGWSRDDGASDRVHSRFDGTISDIAVYDTPLEPAEIIELAGDSIAAEAIYASALLDLMPAFGQLHHASEYLQDVAEGFGYGHHGSYGHHNKDIEEGSDAADSLSGDAGNDYINGRLGDDTIDGGAGNDELQGGYGNDDLMGGAGNDILDGGHGEDVLNGGDGDDFLIAQADGREGYVAFDPDRDEGDPLNELDPVTGKLYPDQPLPADDVLTGGKGADSFYFQTLINAKQRFIEEHTNDDGTIRWHGVAGENDNIHDHWVDVLGGNDIITDYNKAEGDKIIVEGHTTEILDVTHHDSNDDGVVDYSVIQLYSDQGNGGGAHNHDLLGTISVYGDLVTVNDIQSDAAPAYGIVKHIDQLEEAITPLENGVERIYIPTPVADAAPIFGQVRDVAPVFGLAGDRSFSGDDGDYLNIAHTDALALEQGTYAMFFTANQVTGRQGLFSKDFTNFQDGGHLTALIRDGKLVVRFQSDSEDKYISYQEGLIFEGEEYHLAVSFGADGFKVYVDGELVGAHRSFLQGMGNNTEDLVLGANGWSRKEFSREAREEFDGTIGDFSIYDEQLSALEIALLAEGEGRSTSVMDGDMDMEDDAADEHDHMDDEPDEDVADDEPEDEEDTSVAGEVITGNAKHDILFGTEGDDTIDGAAGRDTIFGGDGDDVIMGGTGRGLLMGEHGDDSLTGGDLRDTLIGGEGDDMLSGAESGDVITGNDGDDVLLGGIGRDTLIGGEGADTFLYLSADESTVLDRALDMIGDFEAGIDKIDISALNLFTALDTDGGHTEAGELRLGYSSATDRTYIRSDQSDFEIALQNGDYRGIITDSDFIF